MEVAKVTVAVTADTGDYYRNMQGVESNMQKFGTNAVKAGKSLTKSITLPIAAAGLAAFELGKDFESSMSLIVGLVGASGEQVEIFKRQVLDLAGDVAKAPIELADALYFITSAGLEGAKAMEVLEISAKASAAGLGEVATIADLVTSVINAYGAENVTAAQATDILVAAVREGKADATEFAGALGQVLPIAAEMGVQFEEVAAATAAMTRTGTDAGTANMQLKNIMMGLLRPTKQAEDALNLMGISSAELRDTIREDGLLTALIQIKDLTNEFGEDIMAQVFPNIRSLIGVLDLMGANFQENAKIFEEVANATGALDHAFATVTETAEFKLNRVLANIKVGFIELWDVVKHTAIPTLESFADVIESLTSWFAGLEESTQSWILRILGGAALLGPFLILIGHMTLGLLALGKAGSALKGGVISLINAKGNLAIAMKKSTVATAGNTTSLAAQGAAAKGAAVSNKALNASMGFTTKTATLANASLGRATATTAGFGGVLASGAKAILGPVGIVAALVAIVYAAHKYGQAMQAAVTDSTQSLELYRDRSQRMVEEVTGFFDQLAESQAASLGLFGESLRELVQVNSDEAGEAHEIFLTQAELTGEQLMAIIQRQHDEHVASIRAAREEGIIGDIEATEMLRKTEEWLTQESALIEAQMENINSIVEGALQERGYILESEYDSMMKSLEDAAKQEEIIARANYARQLQIQQEFQRAIADDSGKGQQELIDIFNDHADEYLKSTASHFDQRAKLYTEQFVTGQIEQKEYDRIMINLLEERQAAEQAGLKDHMRAMYLLNEEYFNAAGLVWDEGLGEMVKKQSDFHKLQKDMAYKSTGEMMDSISKAIEDGQINFEQALTLLSTIIHDQGVNWQEVADALGEDTVDALISGILSGRIDIQRAMDIIRGIVNADFRAEGYNAGFTWGQGFSQALMQALGSFENAVGGALARLDAQAHAALGGYGSPIHTGGATGSYTGIPYRHTGGLFRAPRIGGEGLAVLKDRERVLPPGVEPTGRPIPQTSSPNVTYEVNIGTLVADDRGLMQLERKLKEVRFAESKRMVTSRGDG